MFAAFLTSLPFLIVYIFGLVISAKKRRYQTQPASAAMLAYGVLCVNWAVSMFQIGWLFWAYSRGIEVQRDQPLFHSLGVIRLVLHYLALAVLLVCVFIGRKDTGGSIREPAIVVGISVVFMITGVMLERSVSGASPIRIVTFLLEMGAMIGLLTALYGWRKDQDLELRPQQETPAAGAAAVGQDNVAGGDSAPVQPAAGMFEKEDFIPYIAGVVVFAGLLIIPLVWGGIGDIEYEKAVLPSLVSCGIFIFAHDEKGNFSFGRFLIGFLLVFLAIMRAAAKYGHGGGKPMFVAGGLLGYAVMFACGWAGIAIARFLRRKF